MATYVTKKCPYCGHIYQNFQSGEQRKYGCPLLTCARCNESFWDDDIKEPALHGYHNAYEEKQSAKRGITMVIYVPIALFMLLIGVFMLSEGEMMMGLFLLAFGIFPLWTIFSYYKSKSDNANLILSVQRHDYDESMIRLKNTDYLTALAKHDSFAKDLLEERIEGMEEHYATRP